MLDFGAMTRDAIVAFHQPIFVRLRSAIHGTPQRYLGCGGLHHESQGHGVPDSLRRPEAEAITSIKYCQKGPMVTAPRLGPQLQTLANKHAHDAAPDTLTMLVLAGLT